VRLTSKDELDDVALDAAKGNQSEAARLLEMGRATLQDKMRKYALSRGEDTESDHSTTDQIT